MAKRTDLRKILIIGSGPIVIGQACEFDYSGTQACKALMQEGYEVILINSNPATIMTDPEIASKIYIEPLTPEFVERIIIKEKPDAVIPTLGGQTALNLALELDKLGILKKYNVEMLGASPEVILRAEDRESFSSILDQVGAKSPHSKMIRNLDEGIKWADELGFPLILRANFTLGGVGSGVTFSLEEYKSKLALALHDSPSSEVLVEKSIQGWKEFELEIMRDSEGTFVVVCSIENIDPCGVHTGDSITVAPQMTLSDREYQAMRDEAQKIVSLVGVETGGANIQFAVNPETQERVVIEMNPRVSRSSALASKATGFPIAKIAALLAVGYSLRELRNDITKETPSCYEPALDYVVTKIPQFAFKKYHGVKDELTTQMKSVGEVMGIGRTFKESFQKAVLSLEKDERGLYPIELEEKKLGRANSLRIYHIFQALRSGYSLDKLFAITEISPWFLEQFKDLVDIEQQLEKQGQQLDEAYLLMAKRSGFSDAAISYITKLSEKSILTMRAEKNIKPAYFRVDTCAGEFRAETPYFYSTYWGERKALVTQEKPVIALLGSGPNRIGQGIEFDYSCVRSVKEFQNQGYAVVMINSNPETVSTDYDTSDFLFFEPLTLEFVNEVFEYVKPVNFVAQLGGQTPINMAKKLTSAGYSVLGTSVESMDLAEDRAQFIAICKEFDFKIPQSYMVSSLPQALTAADKIGYPIMCRPSYVLGGRRMEIVENEAELTSYFKRHHSFISEKSPCLMDQFLARAIEVDVDLVRGVDWSLVGGIIEHIEAAGVHSGDSMGVIPPQRLKESICKKIEDLSIRLADRMNILGFINLQLAVKNDQIYMIEANPRSSRSLPFMAKATSLPLVNLGVLAMLGKKKSEIPELDSYQWRAVKRIAVKGVVFPFKKFSEADSILGPEMKSTGESMGRGADYAEALYKAYISSGLILPSVGEVFLSLREKDKQELLSTAQDLVAMGYTLSGTRGTSEFLIKNSIPCESVRKVHEGRPHCVDRIRSGKIALVINTTSGKTAIDASFGIRRSCVDFSVPCITESDAAKAFSIALRKRKEGIFTVESL